MENRLSALLGPTKYERAEVLRYRAQRKLRRERCNAVLTNMLAGGKKLTLLKISKLQHVGAITGATKRKKLLSYDQENPPVGNTKYNCSHGC